MALADLLQQDAIIPALKVNSKKQLLQELAAKAARITGVSEREVFDVILQREKLGSTGLGQGVAIPHGRIKGLREAVAALVTLKEPIPFDAPDGQPVNIACILLVPEKATDQHLQILSELAQMFSDKQFRDNLLRHKDGAAIHQMIANWKPNVTN